MNCQNCGAPLQPVDGRDYLYCQHCATFYFPKGNRDNVKVLSQLSHVSCPLCQDKLVTAVVEGHNVLHCPNCRGLLFPQGIFSSLVRAMRSNMPGLTEPNPISRSELERDIHCPDCGKVMDTHPYAGPGNIVIDLCLDCQVIWLDYGELYRTATAPGRDRPWFFGNTVLP